MIHYTCDACKRALDPEEDIRHVVRLEVFAVCDGFEVHDTEGDRDHLQEIQEILQRMEETGDEASDDEYQQLRFDLCPECYKRFMKNPLGLDSSKLFDFSNN